MTRIKFHKLLSFFVAIALIFSLLFIPSNVKAKKFNMSYIYFGDTNNFVQQVMDTRGSVNTISPNYFNLSPSGDLIAKVDPVFIEKMHQIDVKVVPFLSNHWDRALGRTALENREELATQIADSIMSNNLDGVNIDIENVTDIDRDNYTDFVKLLHEKLPAEKEISVAVAANPYYTDKGWQGSYDYEQLAKYSDYLMLMTYDESYYGSEPGPVASIGFVEKSIQYALTKVPADKIVLGIPFYGRYWKKGEYGGRGIPLNKADQIIKDYNGKVYFDEKSKSPYALVYIPYGYVPPNVHYRTLSPGSYIIWYENEESLKLKLKLVQKYNLHGTGSWSLNEEPANVWDYYEAWLNGEQIFVDADNHWASQDILTMHQKGWMVGTSLDYFSPNNPLTRAQATVVLVRALGLLEKTSVIGKHFDDVRDGYWAEKEINAAYQNGLIRGVKEGEFAPDQPLTRAEAATILSRVISDENKAEGNSATIEELSVFQDVSTTHWAYQDIITLDRLDIISGYIDGGFHPKDIVTRAQMAALMNRITNYIDEK